MPRRLVGDQCCRRDPHGAGHGTRPHHRDGPVRLRQSLSVQRCSIRSSCAPRICLSRHGWKRKPIYPFRSRINPDGIRYSNSFPRRFLPQGIEGTVLAINERGGILTDQTVFYATSGGQPGDTGVFVRSDGSTIAIATTVTGESKEEIIHIPAPDQRSARLVGEKCWLRIDWERRYKLMRMHAACHLLSVVCPYPITGAAVGEDDSRVDFDLPDAGVTKEGVTAEDDGTGQCQPPHLHPLDHGRGIGGQSGPDQIQECSSA